MVAEIYLCHFSRLVIDYIVIYVILRYELNYPYNSIILADYKSQRETTSLRSVSLRRARISAFLIEPDVWDMVQEEIDRRKKYGSSYSGNSPFSTRLVCGECGSLYGTKVCHSNDKYRRTIFQCNGKFKNGKKCSTPHLTEEEVKALFIQAFNIIFEEKDRLIEDCKFAIDTLTDYSDIDAEIKNLITELDVI